MKIFLALVALLCAIGLELAFAQLADSNSFVWRQFKKQYGKLYGSLEEDESRLGIFTRNRQQVERHNANNSRSFSMALNHLADWRPAELALLKGARLPLNLRLNVIPAEELRRILTGDRGDEEEEVPDEWDWRKQEGRVARVKDQSTCGSCWAFVVTGLLEGQELARNMSSLVALSDQQIVDCSKSGQNEGCAGGWPSDAIDDLANNIGGIQSELDYPYGAREQQCRADASKFVPLRVKGHQMLPARDEKTLKRVVYKYGPVSVVFDASESFQFYRRGVFEDYTCRRDVPSHAVLLVGYGKDARNNDYWIIKNSWSSDWGEQGYGRFRAGTNMCGIANYPTIATF